MPLFYLPLTLPKYQKPLGPDGPEARELLLWKFLPIHWLKMFGLW